MRDSFGAVRFALLAVTVTALVATPLGADEEDDATIRLPVSFDNVWYRPAIKSGFGSGKQKGLLTVSAEGLEFTAKKRSDFLPWPRVEMVSYGTMTGDADTRWVVVGLEPLAGERGRAGIRDGRKMGYGGATEEIFAAVTAAMKQARAGPYDVPAGYTPYVTGFLQFSLALPGGWDDYEISNTLSNGRPLWGQTIFSPLDLAGMRGDRERTRQALQAIAAGKQPSFFLLRYEAGAGFSCSALKKSGRRRIHEEIDKALRPFRLSTEPNWTERAHRGCTAWTSRARVEKDGTAVDVSFFTISDGQTVYVLAMRGPSGQPEQERFETFTRSLRTAIARR